VEVAFMPTFRHRFTGKCAAGDQFSYQWYAGSVRTIDAAHAAAITWNQALWDGATAGNGLKDHVTADVSMLDVVTAEINIADGRQLQRRETGQVIAGVQAGSALPADVALVVSLRTSLPQASGRGRFYLPQPGAANVTTVGRVSADMQNDLVAALTAAWTGYDTGVDKPVLYSPTFRLTRPILTFNIGDLFDTQRRRENKVTELRIGANIP
jgi:hypothetical protein